MGVYIVTDENNYGDIFVDTVTDTAFGPVMEQYTGEEFLQWLVADPRAMKHDDLVSMYTHWYENVMGKEEEETQDE